MCKYHYKLIIPFCICHFEDSTWLLSFLNLLEEYLSEEMSRHMAVWRIVVSRFSLAKSWELEFTLVCLSKSQVHILIFCPIIWVIFNPICSFVENKLVFVLTLCVDVFVTVKSEILYEIGSKQALVFIRWKSICTCCKTLFSFIKLKP